MRKLVNQVGAIVPIYNIYLLLQIVERPTWWLILLFIPYINIIASIVIGIIISIDLAKVFGKGVVFGIFGLYVFPFVGYPILASSKAEYRGAADATTPSATPTSPPTAPPPPSAAPPPTVTPTPPSSASTPPAAPPAV